MKREHNADSPDAELFAAKGPRPSGWGQTPVGSRVRNARKAKGWSLARLSADSGIPQSTLSKFETNSLSLPLDRIYRLGDALGMAIPDLIEKDSEPGATGLPGRRSIARRGTGRFTRSGRYDREALFGDLLQRRMFPVLQTVHARTMAEFGDLLQHDGEEFTLVLRGRIEVVTDLYGPMLLDELDGIYIDSRMGHAYLNAGTDDALILTVGTSERDDPEAGSGR